MPVEQFANNPSTTLNGAITNVATTVVVTAATGFPVAVAGVSQFRVIIESEILIVTNTAGLTWTVTRGAEGTVAAGHATSIAVTHIITAGSVGALAPLMENVNTVAVSGAAQTIPDVTAATLSRIILTAACTFTFPTLAAGKSFTVTLVQDATGSRTATWPASVLWSGGTAPTLTTAANKRDVLTFVAMDATNWLGFTAGLNF